MGRSGKMESIGEIISRIVSRQGFEKGIKEGEVLEIWTEIGGKRIAEKTEPVALEQGILFVRVNDSAWRNELSLMSEELREKINEYFGEVRVDRIHLI